MMVEKLETIEQVTALRQSEDGDQEHVYLMTYHFKATPFSD